MLVDTHLHLDLEQFDSDRFEVVERALAAGVDGFVLVGFEERHWQSTAALCHRYSGMVRAAGVHPNSATTWSSQTLNALSSELRQPGVVAVGEIGLDFHRDHAGSELQRDVFRRQLELAQELELPVIIHQRSAESELIEILQRYVPLRGVMHCFSGDTAFAERCLELGFHLGIGGVLTYPRSDDVRIAVQRAPLERLLLETDAPYLAPQPWRGRRNEPAYVAEVARQLAQLRGLELAELAEQTTRNAVELFGPLLVAALSDRKRAAL